MKIKHYSIFKNEKKNIDWTALRDDADEEAYFLPQSKEKYLLRVNSPISEDILALIKKIEELKCPKIFSLGSGIAKTEFDIINNSNIEVTVSDNTDSIERLKSYNIFTDCVRLDILKDDIPIVNSDNTIVLLHRVDTEFDDTDLISIFEKLKKAGVKYICFVPTNTNLMSILINELKVLILSILKGKRRTFCGFSRSRSSLIRLWNKNYKIIYDHQSKVNFYILEIKK